MKFTTNDRDNDDWSPNCATRYGDVDRGGWWYKNCANSNLNGINYDDGNAPNHGWTGIIWRTSEWSDELSRSLKKVTMAILPNYIGLHHD